MKLIKLIVVLFLLTFTTHAFAKSSEYYQATIVHLLTECNSKCQEAVFKQEVDKSFISLLEAILDQVRWELSMKEKSLYD
tara:strand:- start:392 stop:631 length:240 start_codon:yes stop_codon:yes gene_type:complete